jgi:hypothetical protein
MVIKPLQESASWDEISHLWFETKQLRLFQIILVNNLIPTWRLIHVIVKLIVQWALLSWDAGIHTI